MIATVIHLVAESRHQVASLHLPLPPYRIPPILNSVEFTPLNPVTSLHLFSQVTLTFHLFCHLLTCLSHPSPPSPSLRHVQSNVFKRQIRTLSLSCLKYFKVSPIFSWDKRVAYNYLPCSIWWSLKCAHALLWTLHSPSYPRPQGLCTCHSVYPLHPLRSHGTALHHHIAAPSPLFMDMLPKFATRSNPLLCSQGTLS